MTEEQLNWHRLEKTHKWKQPMTLYYEALLVSMAAVVQGMVSWYCSCSRKPCAERGCAGRYATAHAAQSEAVL